MLVICLDLEGVLMPEVWEEFADRTEIPELRRTTRDEPDYDKLMQYRLDILDANGFTIDDITDVIGRMEPLDGAVEFLDHLRSSGRSSSSRTPSHSSPARSWTSWAVRPCFATP